MWGYERRTVEVLVKIITSSLKHFWGFEGFSECFSLAVIMLKVLSVDLKW